MALDKLLSFRIIHRNQNFGATAFTCATRALATLLHWHTQYSMPSPIHLILPLTKLNYLARPSFGVFTVLNLTERMKKQK